MKKRIFIQFRFNAGEVLSYLPKKLAYKVENIIKKSNIYSSVQLYDEPLYDEMMKNNLIINNKSIIRLIRENIVLTKEDVKEEKFYEFVIETEEIELISDPKHYYKIKIECKYCGRDIWTQYKDLEIKKTINNCISVTNNSELLISKNIQELFIKNNIKNIGFRKTNNKKIIQMLLIKRSQMQENKFIIKESLCKKCGKPRIVKFENTNNVSLFNGLANAPRIEKDPIIYLKTAVKDISFTNYSFGTIGRIPEGVPSDKNYYDYSYRMSQPKIIISGKLANILYQEGCQGFRLIPCE